MARITNFLKLFLPEEDEYYNVEKDQNENFEKIDTKLKEWDTGKENTITKKTAFNLDKTNLTENDSNKLFTAKGALDLFNTLTTNFTNAVNSAKEYFRTELVKKIDKTSISSSLTSTSTATVLSSAGAKALEDSKLNKAGDTMTGHLNIKAGNYSNISLYNNENQKLLIEAVPNSSIIGQIILRNANSYGSEGNLSALSIPKKNGELAVKSDIDAIENNLKKEITFEVGGEANKYYPVLFSSTNKQCNLTIYRKYNEKAPDTWNTATHKGSLILQLNTNFGNDWDGNPNVAVVNKFDENYSTMASKIMFPNRPGVLIWLRGGGAVYHAFTDNFETNKNLNTTIFLQGYDNPPYHIEGRAGTYAETGAASSIKNLYWKDIKANANHTHDDRYYTEAETNTKINTKHLEIVGKDYGGVLNTAGAKTAGKTYFDNNTKKLFLCKNNNSDTSANVNNYIALDNNSLLDRLENLPRLYLVYSGFCNFLNGSNIILNIPINAKNILILENNDNHLPRSGGHSGGKKMDVATFKKNGLRVKGETHYYYENNTIKAKSATGDWGDDVCLIYFEY